MKFETRFHIGQRVVIIDLDGTRATIYGLKVEQLGTSYHVYWFHNGDRKDAWLFESEIREGD